MVFMVIPMVFLREWLTAVSKHISSHQRCSVKKDVLRNFSKLTGKQLCQSLFFKIVATPPDDCFCKHTYVNILWRSGHLIYIQICLRVYWVGFFSGI